MKIFFSGWEESNINHKCLAQSGEFSYYNKVLFNLLSYFCICILSRERYTCSYYAYNINVCAIFLFDSNMHQMYECIL